MSCPSFEDNGFVQVFSSSSELEWKQASIIVNNQPTIVSARYNALNDDIEIKRNSKTYKLAKRSNLGITFLKSNETYQYISYYGDDGFIYTSCFIVDDLSDELGVFRKQSFKKTPNSHYSYIVKDAPKVTKSDIYYMLDRNNKLVHLTTNRRTIRKAFSEDATSIIQFIKDNKINKRKQEDLITLARYIKSLTKGKTLS